MKRLVFFAFLCIIFGGAISAEEITVDYSFERPHIEEVRLAGDMFDRIILPGAPNGGNVGQPALPGSGASILLPYGTEVTGIRVEPGERVFLGDGYFIEPVSEKYKFSDMPAEISAPVPDETIYNSDMPFPISPIEKIGTNGFRGYQILTLKLLPVQYLPQSGELYYYPDLRVVVTTKATGKAPTLFRGFAEDDAAARQRVDNPGIADSYLAASKGGAKSYDMLIITTPALAASFQPLKDYHDANGLLTEIHTTTDVGSSSPEDVRDYIRDRYLGDGIQYVIIGADDDIIAARDLYVQSSPGGETEYNMPSDVYFACLDGTYNNDGDSNWGEPNDGDGGGDVDLIAEVFVGRASVGNTTEVNRFVTKTLAYVNAASPYLQNVIMVGEHLGFGGDAEYANNYLDELIDGSSNHGYTTTGIPSNIFIVDKLYDYDWPGHDWPKSELAARINSGRHIINHLGHGSPDYAMKLYDSDVMNLLSNTEQGFVYSQTCLAGHLDGTDCWAEYMNIKTDYGAFAVVMNARYGWGEFNSTDGPSQRFNREFWDAVFNTAEGKTELGRANQDSKEDNLYRINEGCMRWCYYELNLFGDPAISIRGVVAVSFAFPGGLPETLYPGQETTFDVIVSGAGDGVPVPGTGQLHYSINGGAYQAVAMTEVIANEYVATLPALLCGDIIEYYVSAEEETNGIFYDTDPGSPHLGIPATAVTTAFEDDFETDMGWTVSGGQWARGIPTGSGGDHGGPDPTSGHTDPNVFGYNLNGDYGNSLPEYHLTSPAIDCSGLSNIELSFWRWLGVEQPSYDHAYVRISTNGSAWTTLWENTGEVADAAWAQMEIDISDYATNEPTVYIRFTMGASDGSWTYCGWNIDDLTITALECTDVGLTISTADLPDWTAGVPYAEQLEAISGVGVLTWSDKYGDLSGTGLSLSSDGLITGSPVAAGVISFTAEVTDEDLQVAEKSFDITVNDVVAISPATLPEWTAGYAFSYQFEASGGTGQLTWADRDGDLTGTGLTMSSEGVLSGTPLTGGVITFTVVASDGVGGSDEEPATLTINDAVLITTDVLPVARLDVAYDFALETTGGTGNKAWTEIGYNFGQYGLMLYTTGQIRGTPTQTGDIQFTARVMDAIGAIDEKTLTLPVAPPLAITTVTVPDWTIGVAYSYQLTATGVVGTATWGDKKTDLDGSGLTLSPSGLISGTPAAVSTITFTAEVTDESLESVEKEFSFTINQVPIVTTLELPDWTQNHPLAIQLSVGGGTGTHTWQDKNDDLAGTGLTLTVNGLLSGTPTTAGDIEFTAVVTDAVGASGEKLMSLHINSAVGISTASLPDGLINTAYSSQLEVAGGTGTLTWSDKTGALTGTGLSLSGGGLLAGTPTTPGPVTLTAQVVDQIGAADEQVYTFSINQPLAIGTETLPDWTVNIPMSEQLEAIGGLGAKTWTDKNGDLDGTGLTLSAAGLLAGTPTTEGELTFIAVVTDASKAVVEQEYTFTINPTVNITSGVLPDGVIEIAYSCQLEATGGTGAKTWSDRDGVLSGRGLTLSTAGLITGTPTVVEVIEFVAEVQDVCGCVDEKPLSIKINPPYVCGDANGDSELNVGDAVYLINFTFKSGPAPEPLEAGDANGDSTVDVGDAVYMINFAFKEGPEPVCP